MKYFSILSVFLFSCGFLNAATQSKLYQDKSARVYVKFYDIHVSGNYVVTYTNWSSNWNGSGAFRTAEVDEFLGDLIWFDKAANAGMWNCDTKSITTQIFENGQPVNTLIGTISNKYNVTWSWPGQYWPNRSATVIETRLYSPASTQNTTNVYAGNVPIVWQFCDINITTNIPPSGPPWASVFGSERRTVKTQVKFQSGGKGTSKSKALFKLSGSATRCELNPIYEATSWYGSSHFTTGYTVKTNFNAREVQIGNYGSLNPYGRLYYLFSDGVDVDVTPRVPNCDYYLFNVAQLKILSKSDWHSVVQDEINTDNGVSIQNYAVNNGFLNNRTNIQAVYKHYEKIFNEQPEWYYWAGLAKLAGAPVYAGLSDAEYVKQGFITSGYLTLDNLGATIVAAVLASKAAEFQTNLIGMNIAVYNDIAWQFEAYRKCGISALEIVNLTDPNSLDIGAWRIINQSINQGNSTNVLDGNRLLLQREQQTVLAPGYISLNNLFPGTTSLMSILAQNPVLGGPSFSALKPSGNIAVFSDRWDWITRPYTSISNTGMLPLWMQVSTSSRLQDVNQPLLTRSLSYSFVYTMNNTWTLY